jgi:hypothetical protein
MPPPSHGPYLWNQLCKAVGKPPFAVRSIQKHVGLYVAPRGGLYGESYLRFLKRVISLRTFNVSFEDIADLFRKEKKIMELLHMDSLHPSPTWYLESADEESRSPGRLLLTGHDVGFPLESGVIQSNLDFSRRDAELFSGREMGEDIARVIRDYLALRDKVRRRVQAEERILEEALVWAEKVFWQRDVRG